MLSRHSHFKTKTNELKKKKTCSCYSTFVLFVRMLLGCLYGCSYAVCMNGLRLFVSMFLGCMYDCS